jgi:hypothetical protein
MVAGNSSKAHHKIHGKTHGKADNANKLESTKLKETENQTTHRCSFIMVKY